MSGADAAAHWGALAAGRFIRVVNFHNTPVARADVYERQLAGYAARFAPVTLADLDALFETGRWHHDRPGLIPVFYEGYRDHVEVALPLLERVGLVGWFFVPTAFVATPPAEQVAFAEAHHLGIVEGEYADGRHAMSWDEVAAVGERHVVAAHTATHASAASVRSDDDVRREVLEPREALERVLGRPPAAFAWLFGQASGTNPVADEALRAAGYRYLFSNARLQRLRPAVG